MNIEDIVSLVILIFALGIWLGARLVGGNPYSRKGLSAPIQPNAPPMPKRKR